MKKFYSFIAIAVVAITAMLAATADNAESIVKFWNFSEWEEVTYSETTTFDGLTVYAASGKEVKIDVSNKTIDGVKYTQCLKFGGTINWDGDGTTPVSRALSFVVDGPSTIEIALTSASSGNDRVLNVFANSKDNLFAEVPASGSGVTVETVEFTGEGENTIILGSAKSGINLYYIKVTTTPADSGDEGEPGTGDGSDDDNIGLNDPTDEVTFDFTAETFDMTVLSGNTQEYNPDPTVIEYKDITLTLNGKTRLWQATGGTELRFYKNSSFIVEAPEDYLISKIVMTGQTGSFVAESYENGTWEGEPAQSVYIGTNIMSGNVAIKTITVTLIDPNAEPELPEIDSFNPLCDAEDGTEFKVGMDVTVVLANEALSIIYDGVSYQGAMLGYPLSVEAGDVVKAGWNAMYANGVLLATSEITVDGTAELPEPTPIESAIMIPNWQYVHFDKVIVPSNGVDDYYFPMCEAAFDEGSLSFMMENMLGLEIAAGNYAVDGFWYVNYMLDDDPVQSFIPTAVTAVAGVETIESLTALADIEDETEVKIGCALTVVAHMGDSMVLVTDGTSFMALEADQALEVGDIIAGDWTATVYSMALLTEDTLNVIGTAETLPQPVEVTADNFASTYFDWMYLKLMNVTIDDDMWFGDVAVTEIDGNTVCLLNQLGDMEDITAGTYSFTGVWMPMSGVATDLDDEAQIDKMFVVVAYENASEIIPSLNALLDIEPGTEVTIGCNLSVVEYIDMIMAALVYDGETYTLLCTEQPFEAGDIIAGNFAAYVLEDGTLYTEDELEVVMQGAVPTPAMISADNIVYSMITANQYIELEDIELEDGLSEDDEVVIFTVDEEEYYAMNVKMIEKAAGTFNLRGFWYEMMGAKIFIILDVVDASTGISSVAADTDANAEYYTVGGVKVQAPAAGQIYIRVANGKATKVRVK